MQRMYCNHCANYTIWWSDVLAPLVTCNSAIDKLIMFLCLVVEVTLWRSVLLWTQPYNYSLMSGGITNITQHKSATVIVNIIAGSSTDCQQFFSNPC